MIAVLKKGQDHEHTYAIPCHGIPKVIIAADACRLSNYCNSLNVTARLYIPLAVSTPTAAVSHVAMLH